MRTARIIVVGPRGAGDLRVASKKSHGGLLGLAAERRSHYTADYFQQNDTPVSVAHLPPKSASLFVDLILGMT